LSLTDAEGSRAQNPYNLIYFLCLYTYTILLEHDEKTGEKAIKIKNKKISEILPRCRQRAEKYGWCVRLKIRKISPGD
jgi:hypothetical protein